MGNKGFEWFARGRIDCIVPGNGDLPRESRGSGAARLAGAEWEKNCKCSKSLLVSVDYLLCGYCVVVKCF